MKVVTRTLVIGCFAIFAFAAGFSVSARDPGTESWYDQCMSRCEQRYQACIVNSGDHEGCYQRFLQCAAVCGV